MHQSHVEFFPGFPAFTEVKITPGNGDVQLFSGGRDSFQLSNHIWAWTGRAAISSTESLSFPLRLLLLLLSSHPQFTFRREALKERGNIMHCSVRADAINVLFHIGPPGCETTERERRQEERQREATFTKKQNTIVSNILDFQIRFTVYAFTQINYKPEWLPHSTSNSIKKNLE